MRQKISLLLLNAIVVATACAQGNVQFRNYYIGTNLEIDAPIYLNSVEGAQLNGTNPLWRAALLGGPTGSMPAVVDVQNASFSSGSLLLTANPADPALTWVNFGTGSSHPDMDGYFARSIRNSRAIPGVDWGDAAMVQVVAWQGNFVTWADAFNAALTDPSVLVGASNPLILRLPENSIDPNLTYLWGLESFAIHSIAGLAPVLEPTTFALVGLGTAALLIFRRHH